MNEAAATLHYFAEDATAAVALAEALGLSSATIRVHRFPDGESLPVVRAPAELAVVYRTLDRPDAKLFPLMLAADALRRAGARRIVLVAPYLPYMRQDAVFAPGEPVSQRVLADLLKASFDRVVTVDAHLHRTRRLDHLLAPAEGEDLASTPALATWVGATGLRPDIVVGPDEESAPWVRAIAEAIGAAWLTMRKVRHGDTAVEIVMDAAASVVGRRVLLVDDICSSGGTLRQAVRVLRNAGASDIVAYVTHALFGNEVAAALAAEGARQVVSSDSIAHASNAVPLRDVLAAALKREFPGQ